MLIGNALNKHHDEEINCLSFNRIEKQLIIKTNKVIIVLEGVEYFELSPFEFQNVIFETNVFTLNEIPKKHFTEYKWLLNYLMLPNLKLFNIDSSVGLFGVILFSNFYATHH